MSADEVNKRIYDVLLSIDDIKEFTVNIKGIQEFKNDKIVKVAVERKLEIIGEALIEF